MNTLRRPKVAKKRKPKVVHVETSPISARELAKINKRMTNRYEHLRRRYPEIRGKVVDFINHTIEDGTLYFTVRFKDKTNFSLRYRCGMFAVGADIGDLKTGNFEMIREYRRPDSKV
jgi:hypothetical protein